MRTELPAQRLQRRLDGRPDDSSTDDDEPDPSALLSRWLPQTSASPGPQWWSTIRADPGRAGGLALAAVAVVAVLVSIFTLTGSDPPPIASANLPPVEMVSASPTAPEQATSVVVSVVGLVHKPGLVILAPGARVADALAAAGGTLDGADLVGLNIAQKLTDGQQIVVGIAPSPGQPASVGSSVTTGSQDPVASQAPSQDAAATIVDLNTATVQQLEALPGIGPVTAEAIVTWRDSNGPFTSVDQLGEVDGIGPARLEKLRTQVRV